MTATHRPAPLRTAGRRTLACLAVALLSACGLPLAHGVQRPGQVAAEQRLPEPISVLPPGPQPDAAPQDVVNGFLAAQGSSPDSHGIARSFLAPQVRNTWRDDVGVTVYDPETSLAARPQPDGDGVVVVVSIDVVGEVGADGAAHVQPAQPRQQRYRLEQNASRQWQLVDVPPGLTLSPVGRDRSYDPVAVQFLAPVAAPLTTGARHLVSDLVELPADGDRAADIVDRLLAGPSAGLRASAQSAVPAGARLRVPVAVSAAGEVTIDLDGPVDLDDQARMDLSAQLVWSLRALPDFTRLRLLVDGRPVAVPGVGNPQARTSWSSYDPEGQVPAPVGLAVVEDKPFSLDTPVDDDRPADEPADVDGTVDLAVDGRRARLAALTGDGSDRTLRLGPFAGPLTAVLRDPGLRSPSWGSGDAGVYLLRTGSRPALLLVRPTAPSPPVEVPVEGLPALDAGALLRVSRDGVRVALVAGGVLQVGRLEPVAGGTSRLVALTPLASGVLDVAWRTGTTLEVLVRDEVPPLLPLLELSVDGTYAQPSGLVGLAEGDPSALAAYGDLPLLVETRDSGRSTVYSGSAESGFRVALRDASRPAYPR